MVGKRQEMRASAAADLAHSTGRFVANRKGWQVIIDLGDTSRLYRIHNSAQPDNTLRVLLEHPRRLIVIAPGTSADVMAQMVRVCAGSEGQSEVSEGSYVLLG